MGVRAGRVRAVGRVGAVAAAVLGAALVLGCPSGSKTKPDVRYEVHEPSAEEKAARRERMKGNRHTQAQLFREVDRLRRPRRGR